MTLRTPAAHRARFLLSAATIALAVTAGLTDRAHAQAFSGSPTVVDGVVNFDRTTPGIETITVIDDAIVNWTPVELSSGVIDFLPAGNTATFQDGVNGGGFVILNRIVPTGTGVVQLNGAIISQLQTSAGAVRGGTVAFYSPTGILVGSTATFDVGNLILTAADPDPQTFQDFGGGNGALSLTAAPGSTARVEIAPGATINATAENSFLALVAPQIAMNGNVQINGSVAYVAAESVDLTLVNGLFDIVVNVGTTVTNALTHTGTTGGPARTGSDANQVIYGVGVGQTQAVQLLFSGNLGFAPASNASIVNGEVILSAGRNVAGRNIVAAPNAPDADLLVTNATVSSSFVGAATRNAQVVANSAGNLVFQDDVSVFGGADAQLFAGGGTTVTVAGDVRISADATGYDAPVTGSPALANATAGRARVAVDTGGSVAIQGNVTVTASAAAGNGQDGGTAVAGTAGIIAVGGDIAINGNIVVAANAIGGNATAGFGGQGGAARGGTAFIQAQSPGAASVTGNLATLSANGTGGVGGAGNGGSIAAGAGGEGRGGLFQGQPDSGGVFVLAGIDQGQVTLTNVALDAVGRGGLGGTGGTGQTGGVGGAAYGGLTQAGVFRGNALGTVQGGVVDLDSVVANGAAYGGNGGSGAAGQGAGGAATGGFSYLTAPNGTEVILGTVGLQSLAQGGAGSVGGTATGGQAGFGMSGGKLTATTVNLLALTTGGTGANGLGTAIGGNLLVEMTAGDGSTANDLQVGSLSGNFTTLGNVASSSAAFVDIQIDTGEARFNTFSVSDSQLLAFQAASPASLISVAGRLTVLDLASFNVYGDLEISTTGTGQILGGPDINTPTGDLNFTSHGGTIRIAGVNENILNLGGAGLYLASNDIEILDGASIGALDVELVANDASTPATVGGDVQGQGYTLTQAEAQRIEAGEVAFTGEGDVIVRDLTIEGSPLDGPSAVSLSGANVSVQGALIYLAGAGDVMEVEADGVLEVITPTGSISVNDGSTLSGQLLLEADRIVVADASLAAQIRQDSSFSGLAQALATNNGPNNPEGYIQAALVDFVFESDAGLSEVYIQNSGSSTTFGGTAARIPGLRFRLEEDDAGDPTQVRLIGYGAGLNSAGATVTNQDYTATVDFGESTGLTYTTGSTFNGVALGDVPPPNPGPTPSEGGVVVGSEVITGPLGQIVLPEPGDEDRDRAFGAAFPALISAAELTIEATVDQAVASSGDNVQWQNDEADEDKQ